MRQRADQRVRRLVEARVCGVPGCLGGLFGARIHRGGKRQLILHVVEDHEQGWADQQCLRHADDVAVRLRQLLHQPHHVIAEITDQSARHRRQMRWHVEAGLVDQRAEAFQRRPLILGEGMWRGLRVAVHLGAAIAAAPDQVRLHADDRIAAARGAAISTLSNRKELGLPCASLRKAATGVSRSATSPRHTSEPRPAS